MIDTNTQATLAYLAGVAGFGWIMRVETRLGKLDEIVLAVRRIEDILLHRQATKRDDHDQD